MWENADAMSHLLRGYVAFEVRIQLFLTVDNGS
jgi:hypothetical protein